MSRSTTVRYDVSTHSVMILATIVVPNVPTDPSAISAAQEESKTLCFRAQRSLWMSSYARSLALQQVTVGVVGPILDAYDGLINSGYASAYLTARTAAGFAWGNMTPDRAWMLYDNTFLRPEYDDSD